MIRRSDLQSEQLHVLQSGLFGNQTILGVIFSDQLSICIGDCTLLVEGFLKKKLISAVSPVLNTGDIIAIFIRSRSTPLCSDESNKYLRGPQSSPKQSLIVLKFISSALGLLFVFREHFSIGLLIETG